MTGKFIIDDGTEKNSTKIYALLEIISGSLYLSLNDKPVVRIYPDGEIFTFWSDVRDGFIWAGTVKIDQI